MSDSRKFGVQAGQRNNFPVFEGIHRRGAEAAETNAERADALRLSRRLCAYAVKPHRWSIISCLTRARKREVISLAPLCVDGPYPMFDLAFVL